MMPQPSSAVPNPPATILPQTIMSKVKVLFFAADPLSVDGRRARLQLDREAREIEREVVAALHRDDVKFETRWATRLSDLRRELLRIDPDIVHFSGHGGSNGLVLEAEDGRGPQHVDAPALKKFFTAFRGRIRVVVLNACHSRPQAEAIAEAVGCAVGTPDLIKDEAAISFSAAFYSSIAYGQSVQAAFDQACATLNMGGFADHEDPELVVRPDLHAWQMFLIPPTVAPAEQPTESESPQQEINILPPPKRKLWKAAGWSALGVTVVAVAVPPLVLEPIRCAPAREVQQLAMKSSATAEARLAPLKASAADTAPDTTVAPRALVDAGKLHQQGDHAREVALYRQAAAAGIPSAMTSLGLAQLSGEGTPIQRDSGVDWLQVAANRGDVRGMVALADAYRRRDGVTRDSDHLARRWYEKAALEGHAEAMFKLADMYRDGDGGPADDTLAFEWYQKAARAGHLDAMVDIGWMYDQGRAVPQNEKVAMCWYRAAADAGSQRGKVAIGIVDDSLSKADDVDE